MMASAALAAKETLSYCQARFDKALALEKAGQPQQAVRELIDLNIYIDDIPIHSDEIHELYMSAWALINQWDEGQLDGGVISFSFDDLPPEIRNLFT